MKVMRRNLIQQAINYLKARAYMPTSYTKAPYSFRIIPATAADHNMLHVDAVEPKG